MLKTAAQETRRSLLSAPVRDADARTEDSATTPGARLSLTDDRKMTLLLPGDGTNPPRRQRGGRASNHLILLDFRGGGRCGPGLLRNIGLPPDFFTGELLHNLSFPYHISTVYISNIYRLSISQIYTDCLYLKEPEPLTAFVPDDGLPPGHSPWRRAGTLKAGAGRPAQRRRANGGKGGAEAAKNHCKVRH